MICARTATGGARKPSDWRCDRRSRGRTPDMLGDQAANRILRQVSRSDVTQSSRAVSVRPQWFRKAARSHPGGPAAYKFPLYPPGDRRPPADSAESQCAAQAEPHLYRPVSEQPRDGRW
jgi:hypothetical protein